MSIAEAEARSIELEGPPTGLWRDAFRRLSRNPGALVGGIVIGIFLLTALFAPQIATHNPEKIDLLNGLDTGRPVWSPMIVETGSRAFRRTCRWSTVWGGKPFARAVRT